MSGSAAQTILETLRLLFEALKDFLVAGLAYNKGKLDAITQNDARQTEANYNALQAHMEHATRNADLSDDAALARLRARAVPDADSER